MSDLIVVDIDAANALRILHNGERRIGYALVNALNKTAKDIQVAEREHVRKTFTVRKAEFIGREAAIISFASFTGGVFEASVRVGNKPRLLLAKFEEGGTREGFVGRDVAVPIPGAARPSKESAIAPGLTFGAMKLRQFSGGKRLARWLRGGRPGGAFTEFGNAFAAPAKPQWRGANRTYQIPGVGVFQRICATATRLVWSFKRPFHLKPELRFIQIGRPIAIASFQRHLRDEVNEAFTHALGPLLRAR